MVRVPEIRDNHVVDFLRGLGVVGSGCDAVGKSQSVGFDGPRASNAEYIGPHVALLHVLRQRGDNLSVVLTRGAQCASDAAGEGGADDFGGFSAGFSSFSDMSFAHGWLKVSGLELREERGSRHRGRSGCNTWCIET